ncbi:hypothetical protein CEE34_00010 [Candidatus Aerophobetes bacterium Ae_b3a]|nr:MAG: hypothetical protein CEE34_00010 [Candidatus Aerophobetes bacterium Ae_b3a]
MADLKVFLSYSMVQDEIILAWRLQTIASSYGITVYVPSKGRTKLTSETAKWIDIADVVIGFVTTTPDFAVKQELQYAIQKKKTVIPVVKRGIKLQGLKVEKVFEFDPSVGTSYLEQEILRFLKRKRETKEKTALIGGLVITGLALLLLFLLTKDDGD